MLRYFCTYLKKRFKQLINYICSDLFERIQNIYSFTLGALLAYGRTPAKRIILIRLQKEERGFMHIRNFILLLFGKLIHKND